METTFSLPTNKVCYPFCDLIFDASHVLIGGTNGSGKSVLIDDLICHLISKYTPFDLRFILIDPKRVSLGKYRNIPHVERYVADNGVILNVLDEVINTMDARYKDMQSRNLYLYDGCYIVIVIDELADLMTTCKKDIMPRLQRIAQLGRASKIKLVCATQAPNRKVIPAELVINFTGRLALRCLSPIESKQIIGTKGAETLPRFGKAIYLHADGTYHDFSIPFTSDSCVDDITRFWESQIPERLMWKQDYSIVNGSDRPKLLSLFAFAVAIILFLIPLFFLR